MEAWTCRCNFGESMRDLAAPLGVSIPKAAASVTLTCLLSNAEIGASLCELRRTEEVGAVRVGDNGEGRSSNVCPAAFGRCNKHSAGRARFVQSRENVTAEQDDGRC